MMWNYMFGNYDGWGFPILFWLNGFLVTAALILAIVALWKYISKK